MPTSARSRPSKSSTKRTLRGRPTLMGTTDIGKRTLLRRGRMGTVSVTAPGDGGEPAAMMATVALVRHLKLGSKLRSNPDPSSAPPRLIRCCAPVARLVPTLRYNGDHRRDG